MEVWTAGDDRVRPTGIVSKFEELDDGGAEVWMRTIRNSRHLEWGEETEIQDWSYQCLRQSSDDILIGDEPIADDPNIPSEAAARWNENHAREWAEENISDLVDVDSIPQDAIDED